MKPDRLQELLLQALETESGGVQVYETAVRCAKNPDLKKEWLKYLEQTQEHEKSIRAVVQAFGIDPETDTPGRLIVRFKGRALVRAMQMAIEAGDMDAAQLVAAECVVDAETKDHQNWSLLGEAMKHVPGERGEVLRAAQKRIEEEEDEHLYHTQGWARELWIDALGLDAALPPPEEEQDVKSMGAAAKAKKQRKASA
jgi:hypothetical protein